MNVHNVCFFILLILQGCQPSGSHLSISPKNGGDLIVNLQSCNFPFQEVNYIAFHTDIDDNHSGFSCAIGAPADDFVEIREEKSLDMSFRLKNYNLIGIENDYTIYSNGRYEIVSYHNDGMTFYLQYSIRYDGSINIYKIYQNGLSVSVAFDSQSRDRAFLVKKSRAILESKFNNLMKG